MRWGRRTLAGGDLPSPNWDGPSDLTAGPVTATQGFYIDASAAMQIEGPLFVDGNIEAVTGTNQWLAPAGTVAAPSITFASDPNTGLYSKSADTIGFSVGAADRFEVGTTVSVYGGSGTFRLIGASGTTGGLNYMSFFLSDGSTRSAYIGFGGSGSENFYIQNDRGGVFLQVYNGTAVKNRIGIGTSNTVFYESGGTEVARIGTTFLRTAGTLQLADGTASAPSLTFTSDTNTGIYWWGADAIAVTTGGVRRIFTGTQTRMYGSNSLWLVGDSSTSGGINYLAYYLSDETTRSAWVGFGGSGSDSFRIQNERPSADVRVVVNDGTTNRLRWVVYGTAQQGWFAQDGTEIMRIDETYQLRVIREGRYTEALLPAGTLLPFAANSTAKIPTGYLEANGQAVSRTTYADLFAALSTLWGAGDGSTTFNVPDLRGRFVIGYGGASGLTAGSVGGTWNHTHSFSDSFTTSGPSGTTFVPATPDEVTVALDHTHTGSVSGTTGAANPPYAAVIWMIKV